jgi:hypothetical protein
MRVPNTTNRSNSRVGIPWPAFLLTLVGSVSLFASLSAADTLRDVLSSQELRRLADQTDALHRRNGRGSRDEQSFLVGIDPNSEFARIWQTGKGPELLLTWLGVNLPNYTLLGTDARRSREHVYAKTLLKNRDGQRVLLEVLVPHPTYHTMVHFKTLRAFNQYEPPTLEAVAEEQLNFNQVTGMYYRSTSGQCSILIKVERLGIVNLSVQQCEYSNIMTNIINSLDFERLNKKLKS